MKIIERVEVQMEDLPNRRGYESVEILGRRTIREGIVENN